MALFGFGQAWALVAWGAFVLTAVRPARQWRRTPPPPWWVLGPWAESVMWFLMCCGAMTPALFYFALVAPADSWQLITGFVGAVAHAVVLGAHGVRAATRAWLIAIALAFAGLCLGCFAALSPLPLFWVPVVLWAVYVAWLTYVLAATVVAATARTAMTKRK